MKVAVINSIAVHWSTGECIVRVYDHVPVSTDFVQSIFNIYAEDPQSCLLTVAGMWIGKYCTSLLDKNFELYLSLIFSILFCSL